MAMIDATAVAARQDRWRRFLAPDAPPGFLYIVRFEDAEVPPRPPLWREHAAARLDFACWLYENSLRRTAWLDDDFVPNLHVGTGTEIFAEAFGCKVHFPDDSNPFALPLIARPEDADRVRVPELSTSSLAYLFDMADAMKERGGDAATMRLLDIQSPMDIAALMLEKSAYNMALIEAPEAVLELADKVGQLLVATLDEWFARYGTDYVAHFPDYFMSGGMTLSEDEVGAVSPRVFSELFLPELAALSARYGGIGIHCCADSVHQWDGFAAVPGMRLLNLCKPPPAPDDWLEPAYDRFADVCVQWHMPTAADGPPESWPDHYPARSRVVIEVAAETRAEAESVAAALAAHPRRFR